MYTIRQSVRLTPDEIAFLQSLPDNGPTANLTAKQREHIADIYRDRLTRTNVTAGWGKDLFELEMKDKWPTGPRMKTHHAQRIVLGWLMGAQLRNAELTAERAADLFFADLTTREANQILISKIYEKALG